MLPVSNSRLTVNSNCAQSNSRVPAYMGWRYGEQCRKFQCDCRPSAMSRSVCQLMRHYLPPGICKTLPPSCQRSCQRIAKPQCSRLVDVKRTGNDAYTVTIKAKKPKLKPLQLKPVSVDTQYHRSDCQDGSTDSGMEGSSRIDGRIVGGKMVDGNIVGGKMVCGKVLGGKMVGGGMLGGKMVGSKMVGGKMVGGNLVGGKMVGGKMVGGKLAGGKMMAGKMVGGQKWGKIVGGRLVGGKMVNGKMVGGRMVNGRMMMGGQIIGGRMVNGIMVDGRVADAFPDRLGKASQFLGFVLLHVLGAIHFYYVFLFTHRLATVVRNCCDKAGTPN